jgi:hypothetical protein
MRSSTAPGQSYAAAVHIIQDRIRFEKIDALGPGAEFASFSMRIAGELVADAPVEIVKKWISLDGLDPKWVFFSPATAIVVHTFTIAVSGGGANFVVTRSCRAASGNFGRANPENNPHDVCGFFEEVSIDPFRFDSAEELVIEVKSVLSGRVNAYAPEQQSSIFGDVSKTIYFTGFKFYDDLGNPIPAGSYSAIGTSGMDWTLSNLPEIITIVESVRNEGSFTMRFTGPPSEVDWSIKASTDLESFTTDLTSSSTITETEPGTYQAVIDTSGQSGNLFFRVEL